MTWEEVQIVTMPVLLDATVPSDDALSHDELEHDQVNCPHCGRSFALDLVGPSEIAARLGVKPQTVAMWKLRGLLPDPITTLSRVDVWDWVTIHQWAEETKRLAHAGTSVPEPLSDIELRRMTDHSQHPDPGLSPEECPVCRLVATVNARKR